MASWTEAAFIAGAVAVITSLAQAVLALGEARRSNRISIQLKNRDGVLIELELPGQGAKPLSEAQIKDIISRLAEVGNGHPEAAKD